MHTPRQLLTTPSHLRCLRWKLAPWSGFPVLCRTQVCFVRGYWPAGRSSRRFSRSLFPEECRINRCGCYTRANSHRVMSGPVPQRKDWVPVSETLSCTAYSLYHAGDSIFAFLIIALPSTFPINCVDCRLSWGTHYPPDYLVAERYASLSRRKQLNRGNLEKCFSCWASCSTDRVVVLLENEAGRC